MVGMLLLKAVGMWLVCCWYKWIMYLTGNSKRWALTVQGIHMYLG